MKILKILYRKILIIFPKTISHKILYYISTGKRLNLKNPKDLNEKIQYLIVYKYREKYGRLADKYLVREFIKEKGYGNILTKLYGIYDDVDDINEEILPNQFVLKPNNGNGHVFICENKKEFDFNSCKKELKKAMKEKYSNSSLENHYKYIKPKIICEEYLKDGKLKNPRDYKFYCYNGHAECILLCTERDKHLKLDYYDLNWNYLEYAKKEYRSNKEHEKPKKLKEMVKIAENLSKGFAFVRVDLYEINNKIYFSELTFTPAAGLIYYNDQNTLDYLGSLLNIENVKKE